MSRIRGKATTDHQEQGTVLGIDVSKTYLDVCVHPSGDRFRVRNDAEVLAEFAAVMKPAPTEPPTERMAQITEIIVARRQVVDERRALENKRAQASLALVSVDWG